jgi:hypothetical protein
MYELPGGLRRGTMKTQRLFITFAAMAVVLASVTMAGALDTSPYLIGTWEDTSVIKATWYEIINPTTKPLDVYLVSYLPDGTFDGCMSSDIPANGMTLFGLGRGGNGAAGAVKVFAFPEGSRKFDPNAVIGGFQRKSLNADTLDLDPRVFNTAVNLKAVTINSNTIGEFTQILQSGCFF